MISDELLNYEHIIERVRKKLGCGTERISERPASLSWSWWPYEQAIEIEGVTDHGLASSISKIKEEFQGEVQAIRDVLDELELESGISEKPKSAEETVKQSAEKTAKSHEIWDRIGAPIRRRGNTVFGIWAPNDVSGSPTAHGMPIDEYLWSMAEVVAKDRVQFTKLEKRAERWIAIAIFFAFVVGLVVMNTIFLNAFSPPDGTPLVP